MNVQKELVDCPTCASTSLELIYDFGEVPLAGYFPQPGMSSSHFLFPMKLMICRDCSLLFISPDISDSLLFEDYRYVSSVGMTSHFESFANWFQDYFGKLEKPEILEIGCNDGPLLNAFRQNGIYAEGIDPATNIVELALAKGLNVINASFNEMSLNKYKMHGKYDYIISCNSFAHISEIGNIAHSVGKSLKNNGFFIVEVQAAYRMVDARLFDFIYHEHKYYYTLKSIEKLLNQSGLYLIDCINIETHGGSYRLIFSKKKLAKSESLLQMERKEEDGTLSVNNIRFAIQEFMCEIEKLSKLIIEISNSGKKICGFGASGRANMLVHYLGISSRKMVEIFDESQERSSRELGCSKVPISYYNAGSEIKYDYCVILAWNFETQIKKKIPPGPQFITPLPKITIS